MGDLSAVELDTPPDDFLPDEPEGAAFHKAFQASGIAGFTCRYLLIERQGRRIAVVPYFLGTFSLGTLLPDGLLKKIPLMDQVQLRMRRASLHGSSA